MRKRHRRWLFLFPCTLVVLAALIAWKTVLDLSPVPEGLFPSKFEIRRLQILDRHGAPLSTTYQNRWNVHDWLPLHQIPPTLHQAFIESEDRKFFVHRGVDWPARFHAALQNALALKAVRGASTITEQVVRMIHLRPRTVWSRWLEGIEAERLEKRFSKAEILEFYLNQVPYAHQRRGVVQAARMYFDRDLETLNTREMLTLVILVRSPSALDLTRKKPALERSVARLAAQMRDRHFFTGEEYEGTLTMGCSFGKFQLPVEAGHFVYHVHQLVAKGQPTSSGKLVTTLESHLQERVQHILDSRLLDLKKKDAPDGAVLVVDNREGEVLAWVNGGGLSSDLPGGWIDAVKLPRQPGSTLKPFLYALALEMGWTPATLIDDSPLAAPIGSGLHTFHNYSRTCYGPLRLRDALGNSLNIPAVRTIQFTGARRFLERLHLLGFHSLSRPADFYGDGLALGDGEVSLFELVQAYSTLAREGEFRPLSVIPLEDTWRGPRRSVFSEEVASLIADILSDPQARSLEFGDGNLLRFPVQTAVKTGTSSDHRDAWAVGFTGRYTVGVWMGHLDRHPTNGITGSSGPGLVLRSVFAELNRFSESEALKRSPTLTLLPICRVSGMLAGLSCPTTQEWFQPGSFPRLKCSLHDGPSDIAGRRVRLARENEAGDPRLLQPTPGLQLAMDPHIPIELEAFPLLLPKELRTTRVEWFIDGNVAAVTGPNQHRYLWPLSRGTHIAWAKVWKSGAADPVSTPEVSFVVK